MIAAKMRKSNSERVFICVVERGKESGKEKGLLKPIAYFGFPNVQVAEL